MTKPHRTKGSQTGQAPKPTLDPATLQAVKPITDTAIPAAAVSKAPPQGWVSHWNAIERPAPAEAVVATIAETLAAPSRVDAALRAHPDIAPFEAAATHAVPRPAGAAPQVPADGGRSTAAPATPDTGLQAASAPDHQTPERFDVVDIGSTIARYMRGEGEAAFAYLRAMTDATSPTALIRLQMGEVQRAADASLTCWTSVVRKASRAITAP